MSGGMWEAMETKVEKTGVAKTKGRRSKRESREKTRRESGKTEKEVEKEKDDGSKKR